MEKLINKKGKLQLPEIKLILKKKNFNKYKLLKLNLKSIDNSKYNSIFKKDFNSQNHNKIIKPKNVLSNTNTEFFKIKLKDKAKIFSYNLKSLKDIKRNESYKYIYNSPEANKNLKRYTKNSNSFRLFNESESIYNSYSIKQLKKIEKPILLQTPIMKGVNPVFTLNKYNKNVNEMFYNNEYNNNYNYNYVYKKENNPKVFIKIPPININEIFDKPNKNDIELKDDIDYKMFDNSKLRKTIRESLLQDINHEKKNNKLYLDFLKPLNHYVDYFQDIYLIPHIKNNFAFSKPTKDFEILCNKLCNKNFLHKTVVMTMNRIKIIKELKVKQKEIEEKEMMEELQSKTTMKWNNDIGENKLSYYEGLFERYELQDSFDKVTNHQVISLADKKLKDLIYSNIFYKK